MRKPSIKIILGTIMVAVVATPMNMFAHGYVQSPKSRVYVGHTEERDAQKYGAALYEPQSLEAPKGFPLAGPADGTIASAGGVRGGALDVQKENYWKKQNITTGSQDFTWKYTASHRTTKWHYYMTKTGWNPNEPLKRADLELLGEIQHGGGAATTSPTHTVDIPANRLGYHVILAVWDIADTGNAFYQVIDVDVSKKEGDIRVDAPTELHTMGVTANSAALMWKGKEGYTYAVYRDGLEIARTDKMNFQDIELQEATSYSYYVKAIDSNGNMSNPSNTLNVTTQKTLTNNDPLQPTGLHTMGVTDTVVDLMWSEREAGMTYIIYRDNREVGRTTGKKYQDSNLSSNTSYSYTIKAIDSKGRMSQASDAMVVKTKSAQIKVPAPQNLQLKSVTKRQVEMSWEGSTGVTYVVYRNDKKLGVTTNTTAVDKKIAQGRTYSYYVKARDKQGNYSDPSETLKVTIEEDTTGTDRVFTLGTLFQPELYKANEIVKEKGVAYRSLVTHYNYGDPTWSPSQARSLFVRM